MLYYLKYLIELNCFIKIRCVQLKFFYSCFSRFLKHVIRTATLPGNLEVDNLVIKNLEF